MNNAVRKWTIEKGELLLRSVGIKEGQNIVDFGCNEGNYTIPAAYIVGDECKVYALDKEWKSLAKVIKKAKSKNLKNVVGIISSNELEIPLKNESVDVVLFYDVLHPEYFPKSKTRRQILKETHRVLKPNGFITVYPTHLKEYGITFKTVISEIQDSGFNLIGNFYRRLIHDDEFVRGLIFNFRKKKHKIIKNQGDINEDI